VQFKPHFIAAGSLFLAAKFHNFILPSQNGRVWWNEFDVAPKQLQGSDFFLAFILTLLVYFSVPSVF